jgi:hypothetical protein
VQQGIEQIRTDGPVNAGLPAMPVLEKGQLLNKTVSSTLVQVHVEPDDGHMDVCPQEWILFVRERERCPHAVLFMHACSRPGRRDGGPIGNRAGSYGAPRVRASRVTHGGQRG